MTKNRRMLYPSEGEERSNIRISCLIHIRRSCADRYVQIDEIA